MKYRIVKTKAGTYRVQKEECDHMNNIGYWVFADDRVYTTCYNAKESMKNYIFKDNNEIVAEVMEESK